MKYSDHFDFHLIVPARICKPLLISAISFLCLALVAYKKQFYLLSFMGCVVYVTSNLYWKNPVIGSFYRKIDIAASILLLIVGTHVATQVGFEATVIWVTALIIQCSFYTWNHFIYKKLVTDPDEILSKMLSERKLKETYCVHKEYKQICEEVDEIGKEILYPLDIFTYAFIPHVTWPNTHSRENAYKQGMIAHMIFVHIMPNIVGIFCLFYFA